jgi:hypothetical protein
MIPQIVALSSMYKHSPTPEDKFEQEPQSAVADGLLASTSTLQMCVLSEFDNAVLGLAVGVPAALCTCTPSSRRKQACYLEG